MSPFAMWLRSHPFQRVLLLAIVCGSLLLAGLGVFRLLVPEKEISSPQKVTQPGGPSAPAALTPDSTSSPDHTPAEAQALDQEAASKDARAFLQAYASYRFDDTPAVERQRIQPYVTPRFADEFARLTHQTAADLERAKRHEVVTATVTQLNPVGQDSAGLGLSAVVQEQVKSDAGSSQVDMSVEVVMVRTDSGWLVDQVHL